MRVSYDLHLHTEYSPDCDTPLERIEAHCLALGLTGIAVTDHNAIEGALRLRDRARTLKVIVGEEVSTLDGDVIGLFLTERIPPRMPAILTMEAIHAQGGLVYLPHPFDHRRARRTGGASLASLVPFLDIVEAFNGKVGRAHYNDQAAAFALQHDKVAAGGSDAHSLRAIGTVYNAFDAPDLLPPPETFLNCLAGAELVGRRRSPLGGWFVLGRRPISMALRRLRRRKS
ncbi:MAG TPA: PHP domain-containing protein [Chthonomonadaceae bacterium]|nr:PHP domain-containing protein [Chthonomonadaceae bacterium]